MTGLPLSLCGHAWAVWVATEKSGCASIFVSVFFCEQALRLIASSAVSIITNFFITSSYFKVSPYAFPIFTQSPMMSPVRRYL